MNEFKVPEPRWSDAMQGRLLRLAASGLAPASWFLPDLPGPEQREARAGRLHIEIVSHCWNYAHMLVYQLSSLVLFPPRQMDVTMTVYYGDEDEKTVALLKYFAGVDVPGVRWNWQKLPRQALFRRAIGRNQAAKNSVADWVWFTDCDLLFREDCLDGLAQALQGRRDALVFPSAEQCTGLLPPDSPLLSPVMTPLQVLDVDPGLFSHFPRDRATGPLQITQGDVARAVGYCESLSYYQQPSETWCKAYEDRAFRWLLRTQGEPIEVPGVYRIRHMAKGRYTGGRLNTGVRSGLRRLVAKLKG
ncbi:glycosyl transferase [Pseudohongiella acticola]|uniref:Glycosyl transferase n=1 Tax=Pseudohongiella acticola TaxID=1524254 RepID=A0A1E8CL78_9GAMM|nr:glycosyltransferase [Pseudohongiella acticola]OFE13045.1 glycosyl transferase [Pseudohongiella acticola]